MICVTLNVFFECNHLFGCSSVWEIVPGGIDVTIAITRHALGTIQLPQSINFIHLIVNWLAGEVTDPRTKDLILNRAINASHLDG